MTTIAEEKARREIELKNAPAMVVMTRLKVIEAVQLAMEMKSLTDQGLSNPYHEMSVFYGQQRSILRGLSAGDAMHFDLPDPGSWNQAPAFTFPSTTQFAYEFVDANGQPALIDDPDLYYLTRKKSDKVLSTIEEDSNAFTAPVQLKNQQQNIINWGATVFALTLSLLPKGGTLRIYRLLDIIAEDDGSGNITGVGISGTVDYQTGEVNLTFSDPISQSDMLSVTYDTNTDPEIKNNRDRIDLLTHSTNYQCVLEKKIIAGTMKIKVDNVETATDDGAGNISGTDLTGTIDYNANLLQLDFAVPEDRTKLVTVLHDSFTNESTFEESYSQVDFMLDTKTYLTSHTLNLINLAAGVLDQRPRLTTSTLLRRKKDHRVVGTVKIICEGMETNAGWEYLTGNAEDTTLLTHNEFKSLLGFLDMDLVNPGNNNDLQNGANPYISSSGRKVGANSYPDIEKNPFWPCTDGTYLGSMIYKGSFVHTEDVPAGEDPTKWATHNDIKWRYGTRPNGYNPATYATTGNTTQNDPRNVLDALEAIRDFSGNNPITIDTGNGGPGSAGISYAMVGDYVHIYQWTETELGSGVYSSDGGSLFTCYYNSVQQLIDSFLNDLLVFPEVPGQPKQLQKLIDLGNVSNAVETDRQAADTQVFNNTVSFKAALNSFLSYHNNFNPIGATYDTQKMTALKAANDPGGFLGQATAKLAELGTVLGDPETAGSYSKIIYDACNYAANKDIGYLRDVIDKFNSIRDIYDMITQKQEQYAMYQVICPS